MTDFTSDNDFNNTPSNSGISHKFQFDCMYCGKEFGDDVIELAKHIGKDHDPVRSNTED